MFIARISKGRTIAEVAVYSFAAPFFYAVLWFSTFGGIGLRQARQALELQTLGEQYFNNSEYFLSDDSTYCYDVPQSDVVVKDEVIFSNSLLGITPVCEFNVAESNQAWFNVMYSFSFPLDGIEGFGSFLAGLSLAGVIIYFITSSDSGSLVVDHLASNGRLHHHWIQRIFWAFTEGGVATALLLAGGSDALSALQASAIVFGLPFTVLLLYICQSTLQLCKACDQQSPENEHKYTILDFHVPKGFKMPVYGGIFNVFEYITSFGNVHEQRVKKEMDLPTDFETRNFFLSLFLPFANLHRVLSLVYPKESRKTFSLFLTILYAIMFVGMIAFFVSGGVKSRLFTALGWSAFFMNGCVLTSVRTTVRLRMNLGGNIFEDFLSSSFLYPQVLTQILVEYGFPDDLQTEKVSNSLKSNDEL